MPPIQIVSDTDNKGFTIVTGIGEVTYVNPIETYRNETIEKNKVINRIMLSKSNPGFPASFLERSIQIHAEKSWQRIEAQIRATPIPGALWAVLKADKKSHQEKLLRSVRLTPFMLANFLFRAYEELGFTYSKYTSEFLPTGIDPNEMPTYTWVEAGKVIKAGDTILSDGELKNAVEHKSGIIAHFLDNKEEWHCLFSTVESLAGKENWQEGQPHYHYISNKYGIPREKVVAEVHNKDYKLFSLPHVPLDEYPGKGSAENSTDPAAGAIK